MSRARAPNPPAAQGLTVLAVVVCCVAGCRGESAQSAKRETAGQPTSNILRSDYAGSSACQSCHPTQYAAVIQSPMHRMTRDIRSADVRAKFGGESLTLGADRAELITTNRERRLRLAKEGTNPREFRVTKVIGGRYREDFAGVELDASGQALGEEQILPVSHLIFDGTLRYKGYSVLVTERPGLEPGQTWRKTCIFCHNTPPAFSALFDELHGPGAPSYQGLASDDAPAERRFRYRVSDEAALTDALRREFARLGAPAPQATGQALLARAMRETRERFDEQHLVELGIGCEACHGGSREHAENPRVVKPSFAVASDFLEVERADGGPVSPALSVNRTCAKCHTVLFSRYPHTWEGGRRRDNPGGSQINSGEARDFLLGGCRDQLSCVACHDPHREDPRAALERLAAPAGDALCTGCHRQFAEPAQARAHTRHAPDSAGSRCINCHMPRKNLGLGYELTRYHRIGSPSDAERVEHDRPLECALCHGDQSVERIVNTMERWYGMRYDRSKLRALYGHDLRIDPLRATLLGGLPHEQAIAAALAASAGRKDLTALVVGVLHNEYPLVRYYGKHAAEKLLGAPLPIDPGAPAAEIRRALTAFEARNRP